MMSNFQYYGAIATLIGCIIGAGVFAIPYAVAQSGFMTGLIIIIILGFSTLMINLYMGEICLRTPGNHSLPSLAGKYLGRPYKQIMKTAMIIGIFGGLIAYIIGSGTTAASLTGVSTWICSLIFTGLMGLVLYFDINLLEKIELLFVIFIGILLTGIIFMSISDVNITNLTVFQPAKVLFPFGVILFAYSGIVAISEMKEELGENKHLLKKAIIIGSLIPMILYIIFSLIVVGVTGGETTEIATIGLGQVVGNHILLIGNLFVLFAMGTSFITTGYALKQTFMEEFSWSHNISWAIVIIIPMIIAISGITGFFSTLDLTGALASGSIYILSILMHRRSQQYGEDEPHYTMPHITILKAIFVVIFVIGFGYQFIQ
jgi:tyrosine-specific transport protein